MTAEKAFKYLSRSGGDQNLSKIPAGKQFWFYLFRDPDALSSDFSNYPCLCFGDAVPTAGSGRHERGDQVRDGWPGRMTRA